ncbi:MAG TPA: glutathione S-transferase [Phenylobacterium sp.]|nr:glutathione S-transferase [Phenylobacterium sp.]
MMLRVYGYAGSINVRKVLWACEELGLAFEREDWGGGFRATSEPGFRAMNPVGMVPVIDDDGVVVWESNTIVRYLAASRGRTDLAPAEPAARAPVESWMDWQASDFNNSWRVVFQGLVRNNPDFREPAALAASAAAFARMVEIVDGQLGRTGGHIAGPDFTVADIAIGLSIHRWFSTPIARPEYENVARYYDRLCGRPGFRRYGRDGGP